MSETRWLTGEEQRHWRAYVNGSARLADRLDRLLRERHGLSMPEYEILVRLSEAPRRRVRMAELASSVSHSRSRLSHTIARLETAGLVCRESCPADGRGVLAVLTQDGFDRLDRASHDHVDSVREHLVDVVSPADLAVIGRAFGLISDRLADG